MRAAKSLQPHTKYKERIKQIFSKFRLVEDNLKFTEHMMQCKVALQVKIMYEDDYPYEEVTVFSKSVTRVRNTRNGELYIAKKRDIGDELDTY